MKSPIEIGVAISFSPRQHLPRREPRRFPQAPGGRGLPWSWFPTHSMAHRLASLWSPSEVSWTACDCCVFQNSDIYRLRRLHLCRQLSCWKRASVLEAHDVQGVAVQWCPHSLGGKGALRELWRHQVTLAHVFSHKRFILPNDTYCPRRLLHVFASLFWLFFSSF